MDRDTAPVRNAAAPVSRRRLLGGTGALALAGASGLLLPGT